MTRSPLLLSLTLALVATAFLPAAAAAPPADLPCTVVVDPRPGPGYVGCEGERGLEIYLFPGAEPGDRWVACTVEADPRTSECRVGPGWMDSGECRDAEDEVPVNQPFVHARHCPRSLWYPVECYATAYAVFCSYGDNEVGVNACVGSCVPPFVAHCYFDGTLRLMPHASDLPDCSLLIAPWLRDILTRTLDVPPLP
ncbi:MAG TPA: hypothetical protein VNZ52_09110 [Candidatus Thermoplasmatota archaeon]|nr:hypothetical protein [Candidatus Thermoplasmatota archaeon]